MERILEDNATVVKAKQRAWLDSLVAQAQLRGYWGDLNISFENGRVARVKKLESLLPPK